MQSWGPNEVKKNKYEFKETRSDSSKDEGSVGTKSEAADKRWTPMGKNGRTDGRTACRSDEQLSRQEKKNNPNDHHAQVILFIKAILQRKCSPSTSRFGKYFIII